MVKSTLFKEPELTPEVRSHQGSSFVTPIKEIQINGVIKVRLNQRKFHDWISKIIVADIFSGDGTNVISGTEIAGSPIEIIKAIKETKILEHKDIEFLANDIRMESVEALKVRIEAENLERLPIQYHTKAADEALVTIEELLHNDRAAHCILLVDPNGPSVMPFDRIISLARMFSKRMDIIVNISETAIKRVLASPTCKDKNWWAGMQSFSDVLWNIFENYKEGWLRTVIKGDYQKWRFACFWNYAPPKHDWSKQGLLKISSEEDINKILEM